MSAIPEKPAKPEKPEPEPDIADEAGPKSTEFGKADDAKQITSGEFDPIP